MSDECRITRRRGVACGRWCLNGVPIFALRNRWKAGDSVEYLAEDYDLPSEGVRIAIEFYEKVAHNEG